MSVPSARSLELELSPPPAYVVSAVVDQVAAKPLVSGSDRGHHTSGHPDSDSSPLQEGAG